MSQKDLSSLRIDRAAGATAIARPRRRRLLWAGLAAATLTLALVIARLNGTVTVETASVTTAYPSQGYTLLNSTGYVVAQRKAAVASKATGRLEWLGVREGSVVKAGEVLARLENRDVTAQMEQAAASIKVAQASLEQADAEFLDAERAFNRSRELLDKGFVAAAAHDTAVARYEKAKAAISGQRAAISVAQANYRAAQVAVEQTLIRAPFEGVVLTKNANLGDVITPFSSATGSQAAVVTMADMSTLEVEADVSESSLSKVRLEQPCEIQLDALPDVRFRGVLHRMVPTVDRSKATVTAKVRFVDTDTRILPEMSAKVAFLSREMPEDQRAPRIVVPPAAVTQDDGRSYVYVVRDGRAARVEFQAGGKIGEAIEVVKGLAAGDKVVMKPPGSLRDGARIALPSK